MKHVGPDVIKYALDKQVKQPRLCRAAFGSFLQIGTV